MPDLAHVVVVDDDADDAATAAGDGSDAQRRRGRALRGPAGGGPPWDELLAADLERAAGDDQTVRPRDVHLHGRDDRPVQGLHAQPQLPRGAGPARSASAGAARPTTWCGPRCRCTTSTRWPRWSWARSSAGGRGAIYRRFSVSQFWPEMNRVGATITSTLGTMAYLLAHDIDRPEMPRSGAPEANTTLAAARRGARCPSRSTR